MKIFSHLTAFSVFLILLSGGLAEEPVVTEVKAIEKEIKSLSIAVGLKKGQQINIPTRIKAKFIEEEKKDGESKLTIILMDQYKKETIPHLRVNTAKTFEIWSTEFLKTEAKDKNGRIEIHYPHNSVIKDGETDSLALHIVIRGLFEDAAFDEKIAVTGDLQEGGDIAEVSHIYHKVKRAVSGKMTHVLIPSGNHDSLIPAISTYGPSFLLEVEIYSIRNTDEAYALCLQEKETTMNKVSELFAQLRSAVKEKGWAKAKELEPLCDQILNTEPRHVSAALLKTYFSGKVAKTFSDQQAYEQIIEAFDHYVAVISLDGKRAFSKLDNVRELSNLAAFRLDLKRRNSKDIFDEKALPAYELALKITEELREYFKEKFIRDVELNKFIKQEALVESMVAKLKDKVSDPESPYAQKILKKQKTADKKVAYHQKKMDKAKKALDDVVKKINDEKKKISAYEIKGAAKNKGRITSSQNKIKKEEIKRIKLQVAYSKLADTHRILKTTATHLRLILLGDKFTEDEQKKLDIEIIKKNEQRRVEDVFGSKLRAHWQRIKPTLDALNKELMTKITVRELQIRRIVVQE